MNFPFIWYKHVGRTYFDFVTIHAFDRETGGRTDRQTDRRTADDSKTVNMRSQSHGKKKTEKQSECQSVYHGKDLWKRYALSVEWKSEGVTDRERLRVGPITVIEKPWRTETTSIHVSDTTRCNITVSLCNWLSQPSQNVFTTPTCCGDYAKPTEIQFCDNGHPLPYLRAIDPPHSRSQSQLRCITVYKIHLTDSFQVIRNFFIPKKYKSSCQGQSSRTNVTKI